MLCRRSFDAQGFVLGATWEEETMDLKQSLSNYTLDVGAPIFWILKYVYT